MMYINDMNQNEAQTDLMKCNGGFDGVQAHAQVTLKGGSDKAAAAELADKEQTILELRETNEVWHV